MALFSILNLCLLTKTGLFQFVVGPLGNAILHELSLTNEKAGRGHHGNTTAPEETNRTPAKPGPTGKTLDLSKRKRFNYDT